MESFTNPATRRVLSFTLVLASCALAPSAYGDDAGTELGNVHNEVAKSLVAGTRYDNIVNIGCGWASGVNFASGIDWTDVLPATQANPSAVYEILTDPQYYTPYKNKYALLVKAALEARDGDGHTINLFDIAKTGHTSPYGKFEIDDFEAMIDAEHGGQLTGNTLVLYEFAPPDFLRLVGMLFDRDPALNPIATSLGGEPFPPGVSAFGDSYWQARVAVGMGADLALLDAVVARYAGHFESVEDGATPYVDETDVLGPPNTNDLTVSDRFFASYKRDYKRLRKNKDGKYGDKVDIIAIGNENPYEGGDNFRQYAASVLLNPAAVFPCTIFPTVFGCRPDTITTNYFGIDEDFVHPFAADLSKLALEYSKRMRKQANAHDVSMINVYELFAGHHSRFDDPTSPDYVAADPTYWAYLAEINAMGHEVVADVMLHILNTGDRLYMRKHSDEFRERAEENEFFGVYYGYGN